MTIRCATVSIDPGIALNMGVRTQTVEEGPLFREIRTVAHLMVNEELLYEVTNKFDGWLDKVYVEKTGEYVKEGQVLFEIYSKDLIPAQTAFLDSLSDPRLTSPNVSEEERDRARSILESTRRRFKLWDIPESWIQELEKTRKIQRTVPIRAASSGVVMKKIAVEGKFFKAGSRLYEIASLESMWALAAIYESERPFVREEQPAMMTLSYIPGKLFRGHVDYVYPYVNPKTRDISVRLVFPNPDMELLPEMYANVHLRGKIKNRAVLVPDSAIINTGERQIVFVVKGEGKFEPREIQLGVLAEHDMREVLRGLRPGEEVVVSGQFMLDSESRVREAILKFQKPGKVERKVHAHEDPEKLPHTAPKQGPRAGIPSGAEMVGDVIYLNNKVCPVLGGPADQGYAATWNGIRVELCCPSCDQKFLEDPRGYLKKIDVDPDKVRAAFLKGPPPPKNEKKARGEKK